MESDSDSSSPTIPLSDSGEALSAPLPAPFSRAVDSDDISAIQPMEPSAQSAPSESRTYECKCPPPPTEKKGRNLVVCIDGTANQFSINNTHVVELYSRLEKNDEQLTYYNSGIGTFVKHSNWIGWLIQLIIHIWDMMVAWNLKRIVLSAYQWLSENYQPGDHIYVFGFSRGAYQVRILAGMFEVVGLLHKGNNDQIGFAYELYLACVSQLSRGSPMYESSDLADDQNIDPQDPRYHWELCKQFKRTLCHKSARVHFVGAWDTVSSVGITRGPSLPETTTGMTHVCGFYHGISLDEGRGKFLPEYGNGGKGPGTVGNVKEVWFTGSHSDIGGGNAKNLKLNGFSPPLRWMLHEAIGFGLRVEPIAKAQWKAAELKSSMTGFWKVLEYIPFRRLSYDNENEDSEHCHTWPPNLFQGRRVQPGQFIHASVIEFMHRHPAYKPAAELNNGLTWEDFRNVQFNGPPTSKASSVIIQDLYSSATDIIPALQDFTRPHTTADPEILRRGTTSLRALASSAAGTQAIIDVPESADILLRSLEYVCDEHVLASHERAEIVDGLTRALSIFPSLPHDCPRRYNVKLQRWLATTSDEMKHKIMNIFGNGPLWEPLTGHEGSVRCVVYSPESTYIISGSEDRTIRLWDAATGQPIGEPLQGHEGYVFSVAFSPDGKRIVLGSTNNTIQLWDTETHQAVGPPLTGHEDFVRSVTFSPDGKLIASGSDDKTIRIWDAETRHAVGEPLRGHTSWVRSVAFSPDGRRIASGSGDWRVGIWDLETRAVVRVLQGHSQSVWSVVFSPDGRRIVSGSWDATIRVWDAESGATVLGPLSGHRGDVNTVAVSPDGRYIASGSDDCTVRLWDAQTGGAVGEPLRGHTGWVQSVAFSPDSRRVVSGSRDNTLMIWEVET